MCWCEKEKHVYCCLCGISGVYVYSECTVRPNMYTKHVHKACTLASFPAPHPASRRLQYSKASDWKLGGGLRTGLHVHSIVFPHLATPSTFTCGGPTSQQLHLWRAYLPTPTPVEGLPSSCFILALDCSSN